MLVISSTAFALAALLCTVIALPQPQAPNTGGNTQTATDLCGDNQNIILTGTPWLVANSMYGSGSMEGTSCTHYDHIEGSQVVWSNTVNIQNVDST